ncbi:calcium-transporting ATPase 2-like protein [Thermochaetoides thermophila DSM 1495]|uniref:Calcium-transporting ATPase n=1 Tax=Chaetomium thermophilum (strain DSM 1495 / CBS 144.50 / IMI 039719) TaxID=759272 RepID=G0SBD2_CHATD|nr:calcium-transporting ATPase 2-like protein [Thermochaetoides thermophila DSM 1495]EGS19512.1 calcium-transporting ATPase 2-like protein [Thermochaetoides thermophila DSM 1495]
MPSGSEALTSLTTAQPQSNNASERIHASAHPHGPSFRLNPDDALTPDQTNEDMFYNEDDRFAFSPGQLAKLLNPKSLDAFYALGGLRGLEKGLRTNRHTGLSVDETDLEGRIAFEDVAPPKVPKYGAYGNSLPPPKDRLVGKHASPAPTYPAGSQYADRKRVFGINKLPEKKSRSLLELAWITYNDKILILLTIAAVVSLALGLYQTFGVKHEDGGAKVEWVEGVAVIAAILIVVIAGTLNDWQMERSFNKLNKTRGERNVKVIRDGKSVEISVYDVMVGDVMHLFQGDIVPADGIFIDGHGVKCDESSATGESDLLKKVPADEVFEVLERIAKGEPAPESIEKLDPFIISGSQVNEGTGTFLVTAVGVNSSYGRIMMSMQTEQEDTPLQKKLNVLADWIARFGGTAALILFFVLLIKFCAELPGHKGTPAEKGQDFLKLFITAVTVVVVAVPEGLPLAVTLALAFATTRMMKDNNLVRVLRACETMGNATTVCSDKTGTLTQNKMTVVAMTLGRMMSFGGTDPPLDDDTKEKSAPVPITIPNLPSAEFMKRLSTPVKKFLIQSNAVNSTAFEGDGDDGEKTFIGSKTEVALLTLCRDHLGAGPVAEERANANVVQVIPFDSAVKYMATVVKLPNGTYRAYVKGASEILLSKCSRVVEDSSGDEFATAEMTPSIRSELEQTITSYAGQTLRTIGSSYRDFTSWPPRELEGVEEINAAAFDKIHKDMTLVAIYGIKDPLRPQVIEAIQDCRRAGVKVRMVTGDNILTARAIAKECGILSKDGIAMEGPKFRRLPESELRDIVPKLEVLARSSPEDKRILVRTLKDLGETVAVTGDGTNDAPALKMADIGFAMGIAGTEVAKEAAAIILMDDNFASIVKGIAWGRAVNDAVKKFLQFQLTVNVTAVVLTFVSSVASAREESVLKAVQLLWVNLIMDTLAALALATDPPSKSILDRKPDKKSDSLITTGMAKMIIGQAICQLAITLVLNFAGAKLLGYDTSIKHEATRLNTLIFNTFVWLQIFNELNNRRLDSNPNIFEGITRNMWFICINLIMIGGQILIIFVGGRAFQIVRLNGKEWGLSVGLGAISLPWGALIRLFPDEWARKLVPPMPAFIKKWQEKRQEKKLLKLKQRAVTDLEAGATATTATSTDHEREKPEPIAPVAYTGTGAGSRPVLRSSGTFQSLPEEYLRPQRSLTVSLIRGKRAETHISDHLRGRRSFRRSVA